MGGNMFTPFDFAKVDDNYNQTKDNSISYLNATEEKVTMRVNRQINSFLQIRIPTQGPIQRIIGRALIANGKRSINYYPCLLDRLNNETTTRRWTERLNFQQLGAVQAQAVQDQVRGAENRCTVMSAEGEENASILSYASRNCTERQLALCLQEANPLNVQRKSPSARKKNKQSVKNKKKKESTHNSQDKNRKKTKKRNKEKLKWVQKRSKRSAIFGYAGEERSFVNDCGLDMCLWVPPFVVGSSLLSSSGLPSVLSSDSAQERYTIVDKINSIQSFDQFMKVYQRSYSSYEEQQYRESLFLANLGKTSKQIYDKSHLLL